MCGIIGYVGPRECKPLLLQGLERLEYRGYDSAGIALREEGGLVDFVWSFQPSDTPRPLDYSEVPTVSDESKAQSKALRKKGFAFD